MCQSVTLESRSGCARDIPSPEALQSAYVRSYDLCYDACTYHILSSTSVSAGPVAHNQSLIAAVAPSVIPVTAYSALLYRPSPSSTPVGVR